MTPPARVAVIAAIVVIAIGSVARADPPPRLVLADTDVELRKAIDTALQPWHVDVVVDAAPVADTTGASERADARHARFVVWRDRGELVVFDATDQTQQRRPVADGTLDPVAAASAALSVKTVLRLPPLEGIPIPAPHAGGLELDVRIGAGGRLSSDTTLGAFAAAALVRPWTSIGIGFGAAIEADSTTSIDAAGFKGTWTEQAITAFASVRVNVGPVSVEPWLGAGVVRSALSGSDGDVPRDDTTWLFDVRGGAWVWWRWRVFELGGGVTVDDVFSTPTYTKVGQARAVVFEVPSFGVVGGVAVGVAFDL